MPKAHKVLGINMHSSRIPRVLKTLGLWLDDEFPTAPAGRPHNRAHLMEERAKVRRVTARRLPGAPHETLLVLAVAFFAGDDTWRPFAS